MNYFAKSKELWAVRIIRMFINPRPNNNTMKQMIKTMPKVVENRRYVISEVASILKVPVTRLYLHAKNGKIHAEKREVDNKLVVTSEEIIKYWHQYN